MNPANFPLSAIVGVTWFILVQLPARAGQETWPRLHGSTRAECKQAMQLAQRVYNSSNYQLNRWTSMPRNFPSAAILQPNGFDISGGDALVADPGIFDKLPIGEPAERSVYWQKHAALGYRLALRESSYGWRGDTYTLLVLAPDVSVETVRTQSRDGISNGGELVAIDTGLLPPRLYRRNNGDLWAITLGESWDFLGKWTVYVPANISLREACTIHFRPAVKHGVELLPPALRKLEALLDHTMGSGIGEGTMQPTSSLRQDVAASWANAALRPWATVTPHNTRAEVDAGLQQWAMQSRENGKLLQRIRRQYSLAQGALARYYQLRFGIGERPATRQARFIMDSTFRSHYVFSTPEREAAEQRVERNPWKRE